MPLVLRTRPMAMPAFPPRRSFLPRPFLHAPRRPAAFAVIKAFACPRRLASYARCFRMISPAPRLIPIKRPCIGMRRVRHASALAAPPANTVVAVPCIFIMEAIAVLTETKQISVSMAYAIRPITRLRWTLPPAPRALPAAQALRPRPAIPRFTPFAAHPSKLGPARPPQNLSPKPS